MRIDKLEVAHFRCLENCEVEFSDFTALVGPNGVGKSTLLESLRYFFTPKYLLSEEDVNPNCAESPISVTVQFHQLSSRENTIYGHLLVDGRLRITKTSSRADETSWAHIYEVDGFAHHRFEEIRALWNEGGAIPARSAYNEFVAANRSYNLSRAAKIAEVEVNMRNWELENMDKCSRQACHFEFAPKGGASLSDCTQLIYIPAVREARSELEGNRSPLQELLASVVLRAIDEKPELLDLRERFQREYLALFPQSGVPELDGLAASVTMYLSSFAPGSQIQLGWDQDGVPLVEAPEVKATIIEDDFQGDIAHKGHGVQRAVIVALVHAMNIQRDRDARSEAERAGEEIIVPDLLLVIEEPELYQHPARARHFSKALRALVSDSTERARVQVIISTHSPYFVSLANFESVRLLRRKRTPGRRVPERMAGRTTLDQVAAEIGSSFDPPRQFSGSGLAPRLHDVLDSPLGEGFFADSIVLVEGVSDQSLIAALCANHSFDPEEVGLAILQVAGKNNLDKALVIFRKLGIPTFVMFDADGDKKPKDREANTRLLRLLHGEIEESPDSRVYDTYAVHKYNLESQIESEYGHEAMEVLQRLAETYGYDNPNDARKVPAVMTELLNSLAEAGRVSSYFESIFERIKTMAMQHQQTNFS